MKGYATRKLVVCRPARKSVFGALAPGVTAVSVEGMLASLGKR